MLKKSITRQNSGVPFMTTMCWNLSKTMLKDMKITDYFHTFSNVLINFLLKIICQLSILMKKFCETHLPHIFFSSIRIWKIYSLLNCNKYPLLKKYCNNKKLCENLFTYLIIINGVNLKELIHQFLVCCSHVGQARIWDQKIVLSLWSRFFLSTIFYHLKLI